MIEGGIFVSAGLAPGVEEIIQSVLSQHPELLPPDKLGELIAFFAWLQRLAIGFGLLCVFGGWGASQRKRWGRWAALAASVGNLLLFLPLGIAGLIVLLKSEPKSEEDDKRAPAASGKPEPVSHVFVMIASLAIVVYASHAIRKFAAAQGLPVDNEERLDLVWILVGQLVFTLFHEIGHLIAAWAVGFQFHEINVGPFTLKERPGGSWAFGFDYKRILMAGGYLQAVPRTEKDLRMNWILVVIAGPAASLFTAMVGFLTLVSLPGTPYANYWGWAEFVTAICVADCIANLIPVGSSDGDLLLHTALNTKRGKGILAGLEAAMLNDRVGRSEGLMDPVELLEARRQALEHLEKNSEVPELAVAVQRIEFAQAALRNGRTDEAAAALEEAGKKLDTMQGVPNIIWFRYWADTYEAATARRQYSFAANSRQKALEYGDMLNGEDLDWDILVPVQLSRARLMMSDGDFLAAVLVMQETRGACPSKRAVTAFAAELLAVEGECELRLGRRDSATALTTAAIEIAQALPAGQRALAMELLAHTAVRLSAAGDYSFAQPLFEAAVQGIESAAAGSVSTGYRTAWAEALYENGELAESKAVLAQMDSSALGVSPRRRRAWMNGGR
jgi:tetratricopeptide (TPR) repeat protein